MNLCGAQMKILVGIPVIYCYECVDNCVKHLRGQSADVLIVDNNAEPTIKDLIKPYQKIVNQSNVYVNPAWNQLMQAFLNSEYDLLVILNSDLYIKHDLIHKLKQLKIDEDKIMVCLNLVHDFNGEPRTATVIPSGAAGVFLALTKTMAKAVYPIPDPLKLWFGDNWIYQKLQKLGYKLTVYSDLQAKHGWSRSVSVLPEAHRIIEEDKVAWQSILPTI